MRDFLEQYGLRAATLDELLSDRYVTLAGEREDASRAAARLAAWCDASASGDWTLFIRRLACDGLTLESIMPRLATVARRPSAPEPGWLADARWIVPALRTPPGSALRARHCAGREPVAFEDLLLCLVGAAEHRCQSAIPPLAAARLTDGAGDELARALLESLSALCAPALFDGFVAWRRRGEQAAAPGSARATHEARSAFDEFVACMRATGFERLFSEKPVLLRLIASTTRQWIDATAEFVARLGCDADALREHTGAADRDARIVSVQGGLSDVHNFGRSVLMLTFADDRRLLYKPKDLRADAVWHRLVTWLNANGAPLDLRAPRVLARDGYGWVEFIPHRPCASAGELERYFERAGAWLALFHVFCAADMHLENIVAAGEHPVPVDLEMLLQADAADPRAGSAGREAVERAARRIDSSVTAIGLLPAYARSPDNDVLSLGGLDGRAREASEPYWSDPNSDRMRPARRKRAPPELPNVPALDGTPVRLCDYADAVRRGFERYGRFLIERKDALVDAGWVSAFAGVRVRRLLKPTRFYSYLLERLRDHRNMTDGAQWSARLEFIARLSDWDAPPDRLWPLFRAERNALAELNIPCFYASSDGFELRDGAGLAVHDRDATALARATERLRALDESELEWQSKVIAASIADMSVTSAAHAPVCSAAEHDTAGLARGSAHAAFSAAARDAYSRIAALATRSASSAAWIGLDYLGDSDASQLVVLGPDLYNGAPGIALFLAAYARVTGSDAAHDLALAGIAPLRSHLHGANTGRFARGVGLGAATGLGSVVYALATISALLHEPGLLDDAMRAARLFTRELIEADQALDVVAGSAGGILGLLKAYRLSGDGDVRARAVACGRHLLARRLSVNGRSAWPALNAACGPLTGMSHGAAGYAHAFASLYQATEQQEFASAARDCIDFENDHFSMDQANWPDLRPGPLATRWPCQWCYGAGGIGLARLAMARHGHAWARTLEADVRHAALCVTRAWPSPVDTLCCGNLGNIELLEAAGRFLDEPGLRDEAARRLASVIDAARRAGDYRWGNGHKDFSLGLFRGIAGVGYTALRRLAPDLPDVLVWE